MKEKKMKSKGVLNFLLLSKYIYSGSEGTPRVFKSTDQGQKPLIVLVSDPDRYFYLYLGGSLTTREAE